jgi:hypothetical protein
MSRAARDWVWALSVTPVQKLVIMALAERADDEGHCFPSLAQRIVERLMDLGSIMVPFT